MSDERYHEKKREASGISNQHWQNVENGEKGPRNYDNPEPLNTSHKGKAVVIALVNGRSESGILKALGQYTIELELQNKKTLIVNKAAILTVSIL